MTDRQRSRRYVEREAVSRQRIRARRQQARRKQQRLFLRVQRLIIAVIFLLVWNIRLQLDRTKQTGAGVNRSTVFSFGKDENRTKDTFAKDDYPARIEAIEVAAPVKRSREEIFSKIEALAADSAVIHEIWENRDAYPDNMLEALANNPEMADFVSGYPTSERQAQGTLTDTEKEAAYPLFLQWDPRWGYAPYGDDSCIGIAGCGPTCLSMALYALTRDASLTPAALADYSMQNGYYMSGTGTMWSLMNDVPPNYGVKVSNPGISDSVMKQELSAGKILICAMRPGDFTAAGHFIVIYGYDESGFFINDPNCVARSVKSWSYDQIGGQIKQLWSFGI